MGTAASTSISILRDGELWGLIACHNREPKVVPHRDRAGCVFLGQVFSIQLAAKDRRDEYDRRMRRKKTAQARLLAGMSDADDFVEGLVRHGKDLLDLADATGAAILHEGHAALIGICPEEEEVGRIADWLVREGREDVLARDSLLDEVVAAFDFKDEGQRSSGNLDLEVASRLHPLVPPRGDPHGRLGGRPVQGDGRRGRGPHPPEAVVSKPGWRPSGSGRSRGTRSRSRPPPTYATRIVGIVLRRAEERAQLSTELERSNKELEAFSYSVSHDLRAPFRHIVGYSDMLREEEGDRLSSEGKRYLNTIIDAAQNAGTLVDNFLAFSRMGRTTIHPVPIDMD